MFTRIGRKIKILAQALCWLLILISVVGGIFVMFNPGLSSQLGGFNTVLLGLLIILLGSLLAWLGSFVLYGFGELVDNSTLIKDQLLGEEISADRLAEPQFSPLTGLSKAARAAGKAMGSMRSSRHSQGSARRQETRTGYQAPQQPAPGYSQPRQAGPYSPQPSGYQQPQTGAYPPAPGQGSYQPTSYQRTQPAGAYQPSPAAAPYQQAAAPAKTAWYMVDAQTVQCPNCRLQLPQSQVKRLGRCPQCGMPYPQ